MSIREAILLALRYNPDNQSQELDRITQRYSLRQAEYDLELQYALTGTADFDKSTSNGVKSPGTQSYLMKPELSLLTKWGTQFTLTMDNNYDNTDTYNPVIDFNIQQPLLRNFGPTVNEQNLLDTIDSEVSNKLQLRQGIIDQVSSVINNYRSLILAGNTLDNTRHQLEEAIKTYEENKLKIKAGELERTGNIQQAYQVESLRLQVVESENSFKTSAVTLLQSIGLDPNMNVQVPSDVTLDKVFVPKLQPTIAYALEHNTGYLQQQISFRQTERAYRVALNGQLWELDLTADVQTGSSSGRGPDAHLSSLVNGRNVSKSVNLNLTVPINDVNLKAQLIQAKVDLENARISLIKAKRDLMATIRSSLYTLEAQANSYKLAKKQVVLAQQSYELEKNTQNQLLDAQNTLITAKIQYLDQLTSLEQILGTTLDKWNIKLRYVA